MQSNQRHYPVLNQIVQNDRKGCLETCRYRQTTKRSEYVHATVEEDLIGPGHMRSRSRSRPREATRRSRHRSSSKAQLTAVRPGLEIHLPQRGRYIVVEDVHHAKQRSTTPEFVLVNKENGRAIPLHSLYQNPQQPSRWTPPTDPPVDYDKSVDVSQQQFRQERQQKQDRLRKARSMSDLSEDSYHHRRRSPIHSTTSSFESSLQSSVKDKGRGPFF